jgi:hypothetical protein
MFASRCRCLAPVLLCAGVALPLAAGPTLARQPPDKMDAARAEAMADKKASPAAGKADEKKSAPLPLPANAVIFVCEHAAEALRLVPYAVILSPKKYQELLDEIERLRTQLQSDRPALPSTCHLKGKVEHDVVTLQAQFDVVTERPNSVVALACAQAGATAATVDGRAPLIRADPDGFHVSLDKAGKYLLNLDLVVPLSGSRSDAVRPGPALADRPVRPDRLMGGRGFELALPRAAITTLELDLPAGIKDVRVNGRPLSAMPSLKYENNHLGGGLGPGAADRVEVTWKEARPPAGEPVLAAEGTIQVRLDPGGQTTEADLLLQVEGGQTDRWQLVVPPQAEVKVAPADDGRVKTITTAAMPFASLRTIHLKEAGTDPLHVLVTVRAPPIRPGAATPVGPFFVLGAARQSGTLLVKNRVASLHLDYQRRPGVEPATPTEEQRRDASLAAAFTYANIPRVDRPQAAVGPASLSWLDLEAESVRGQVRTTRLTHTLTLRPEPLKMPVRQGEAAADRKPAAFRWELSTVIVAVPKWADIEHLKVLLPDDFEPEEDSPPVATDKDGRFILLRLAAPPSREGAGKPVTLTLRGRYSQAHKAEGHTALALPRPLGAVDQGEITVQVPRDIEASLAGAERADLELVKQTAHEQTWRCRRVPPGRQVLEVDWHPYHPELHASSVVDVELSGNRGEVRRHEILLHSPQGVPTPILLNVPAAITDLDVIEGGALESGTAPGGRSRAVVPAKAPGPDHRLVLKYSFTLGDKGPSPPGEPFAVPLVTPAQATRGETKVRLWSEPGCLPAPASDRPWEPRSVEEVKDRPRLPVLVLRAPRTDAPLLLRAGEPAPVFTVLAEEAVVRATLLEGGGQLYQVSYRLRQLAGTHLDVELPAPVATVNLKVTLDHKEVTPDVVNEAGRQTDGGTVARLRLAPDLVRPTSLLELTYQLPPGRTGASPLHSTLSPPLLRGAPAAVPTRWQVVLPPGRVLLAPESAAGLERTWVWRGWLLAARLAPGTADGNGSEEPPALVCWQDAAAPLTLTHAPQQAWLLMCSLGLLTVGLGLFWSARPRPGGAGHLAAWLWPVLGVLILAAALAALFRPTTLWAVVYGCEPGAVVLAGVVGVQWLLHQRYRRQIVFLPSFSRGRSGSSLLRKGSSHRPPGEPSTVDAAPPPAGSSAQGRS